MIAITPVYAALIALLMAALSARVGVLRGKHRVALGDGDNPELALGVRRFGNLSEYAAVALLLLLLMELKGIDPVWLHSYGGALLILRLLHQFVLFGSGGAPTWKRLGRIISAAGTATLLVVASIVLLIG